MIISRVNGGLGNQMFQYAVARALAAKFKTEVFLDLQDYSVLRGHPFALNKFSTRFRIATLNELKLFGKIPDYGNPLGIRIKRKLYKPIECKEEHFHYSPTNFVNAGKYTYIDGYWQCEKYFKHIRNQLLQDFTPANALSAKSSELMSKIIGSQSVSLHIRRGDYVLNPDTNAYHGTCSIEYYKLAANKILEHCSDPHFFIFSDDIEWAKENLNFWNKMTFVDHNDLEHAWEDMTLMAGCSHNIIANSTFSWWAAWLNNNVNKIVIAPEKWFNNAQLDYSDIVPEGWLKI
jgi:hypothetical protein